MESVVLLSVTLLLLPIFYSDQRHPGARPAWIGIQRGWIEQLGAITETQRAVNVGVIDSLIMPASPSGGALPLKCSLRWRCNAHFPFSPFGSEHGHDLLCRTVPGNRTGIRHRRFSQRDL